MKLSEFEPIFQKVKTKWPKFYTAEMEGDIYLLVEAIPALNFERFVKNLMWRKVGDPPMIDVFHAFKKNQRGSNDKTKTTEELREEANCQLCFDGGGVHTRDLEGPLFDDGFGESMFFRCPCVEGKLLHKDNITDYHESWAVRYRIHPIADPISRKQHHIKFMTIDGLHPYPHMKSGFKDILEGA